MVYFNQSCNLFMIVKPVSHLLGKKNELTPWTWISIMILDPNLIMQFSGGQHPQMVKSPFSTSHFKLKLLE